MAHLKKVKIYIQSPNFGDKLLIVRHDTTSLAFGYHRHEGNLNGYYRKNFWNWSYSGFNIIKDEYVYIKNCEYVFGKDILDHSIRHIIHTKWITIFEHDKKFGIENKVQPIGIIDRKNNKITILFNTKKISKMECYGFFGISLEGLKTHTGLKLKQSL